MITETRLTEARPTEARLTEARLTEARLTEAKLTRARLTEARLTEARLTEAIITEARTHRGILNSDVRPDNNTIYDRFDGVRYYSKLSYLILHGVSIEGILIHWIISGWVS